MQAVTDDPQAIQQALRQIRAGEAAAWELVVGYYQEPLFRIVYLILRDAAEAEDVAQEAFIRAYQKLPAWRADQPFRPWLFRLAINLARNRRRGLRRYWDHMQRWQQQQPAAPSAPAIELRAEQRDQAHLLWQAVGQLSRKAQDVIYLRYYLSLSEQETAATLSIPAGTVKSRLSRAQQQLRLLLEKDYPGLLD